MPPDEPGVLARGPSGRRAIPRRIAVPGLVVEVARGTFVGSVISCDADQVVLEDRRGRRRSFALGPGAFLVDDVPVDLVPEQVSDEPPMPGLSATPSGSVPAEHQRPRVARASRILVEGSHDAQLLERVWGDDLRAAAIVIEPLHGADDLAAVVTSFSPAPTRRLGILLDHLVPGSKESRLAAQVRHPDVLIVGHPFVDIWAAIDPAVLGRTSWPEVPRTEAYKDGFAQRLGYPDRHTAWRELERRVSTWRDLDRSLIHAVESLLDHVTLDDQAS